MATASAAATIATARCLADSVGKLSRQLQLVCKQSPARVLAWRYPSRALIVIVGFALPELKTA